MQEQTKKKKKRRMRLPNGIGSVHLIGDGKSRRKPWRARVPSHIEIDMVSGKAVQKYITIGYYEKEADAIAALFEYRKDPYTLEASVCTFADVFEMWKDKNYKGASDAKIRAYNGAYKNSEALHKMKMRDIRTSHLEKIMYNIGGGFSLQSRLKTFWGQLFKYALEHDIVQKNYAEFVKVVAKDTGTNRTAISAEDRERIWVEADKGDFAAEVAILLIYTGMRPSELLEVQTANVDIENRILIGGIKTRAGKDRHIPIHKDIIPIIEKHYDPNAETLLHKKKNMKAWKYPNFLANVWTPFMEQMDMKYTPHYGRHTLATMMREADIAEDVRKLILGHKNGDITDRYTHISDAMLVDAIDLIEKR